MHFWSAHMFVHMYVCYNFCSTSIIPDKIVACGCTVGAAKGHATTQCSIAVSRLVVIPRCVPLRSHRITGYHIMRHLATPPSDIVIWLWSAVLLVQHCDPNWDASQTLVCGIGASVYLLIFVTSVLRCHKQLLQFLLLGKLRENGQMFVDVVVRNVVNVGEASCHLTMGPCVLAEGRDRPRTGQRGAPRGLEEPGRAGVQPVGRPGLGQRLRPAQER